MNNALDNILTTLAFYIKLNYHVDGYKWHSYRSQDQKTSKAIQFLVKRGYLEINQYNQARYTGKVWA